jgi:hypothetical protein
MDHATDPAFGPCDTARQALGQTPWLRHVPAVTLDRLAEQSVLHRVPAGSTLFEQSETPAFAQVLLGGCVDLIAACGTTEAWLRSSNPSICSCLQCDHLDGESVDQDGFCDHA